MSTPNQRGKCPVLVLHCATLFVSLNVSLSCTIARLFDATSQRPFESTQKARAKEIQAHYLETSKHDSKHRLSAEDAAKGLPISMGLIHGDDSDEKDGK